MPQWEKGQSGNPAGRPVGSKNVQSQLYEELQTHGLEILAPLIEKAKSGESPAARFLLRRLLPAVRSAPIQVPLQLEGSPSQQAEQVKHGLAEGRLTIEEAKALLDTIEAAARIKEACEIPDRIRVLEARMELVQSVAKDLTKNAA